MILSDLLDEGLTVVDSYEVRIPTTVSVSRNTLKSVNLNIYRNLHHHHLNSQKKNFAEEVMPLLKGKPRAEKIWIHYTIFGARRGKLDTMNVGAIADKYFSDTLVEARKIPDDNNNHIVLSTFSFGGVCPMDGHAIATVNILGKEANDMRVILDENDIQTALENHVQTLNLPNASGVLVSIVNISGMDVIQAEIMFNGEETAVKDALGIGEEKTPPKRRGGRPKGAKNKPKPEEVEETADAVETGADDSHGSSDDPDSGGDLPPEDGPEEGTEDAPKTKGRTKGNLFGDGDEGSSDSPTTSPAEKTTEAETETPPVRVKKKQSIFDA